MTVNEIINKLASVENKEKEVVVYIGFFGNYIPINVIADNEDELIVGDNLPEELFEKDYKYERG